MQPPPASRGVDALNPEQQRLGQITDESGGWRRWGPYLADRAWGTVREDYSRDGDAWNYLTYDHSRAKAYRWGEDGIAGLSDRYQILCFAPAFWNGADTHLKERLFGVTPWEGNHGEDAKEWWVHVDNTPTHSFMSLLYRYPQAPFPYSRLVAENVARQGSGAEFELADTGVFDDGRYFDIVIEYAKRGPVWFPTTFLIIESLRKLGKAFGPEFTVATPASGHRPIAIKGVAADIATRLKSIFLLDSSGRRPVWGPNPRFPDDPAWRDELQFFEYFHGDDGTGLGASHQTGWTALVANLIDEWR